MGRQGPAYIEVDSSCVEINARIPHVHVVESHSASIAPTLAVFRWENNGFVKIQPMMIMTTPQTPPAQLDRQFTN